MSFIEERIKKEKEREEINKKKQNLSREKMLRIRREEVKAFESLCLVDMDPDSREMKIWIEKTTKWDEARSLKPMIAGQIREQVYEEQFDEILQKSKQELNPV